MKPIQLRTDIPHTELYLFAKSERNAKLCKRLLGIAHLLENGTLSEARKIACLSEAAFRVCVHKFNNAGIPGLKSRKPTGRPLKLTEQVAESLKTKALSGPDKASGVVRYRVADLQKYLAEEHKVKMCKSGVWYKLQQLGLSWKSCRQRHPKSDESTQETFKKTSALC